MPLRSKTGAASAVGGGSIAENENEINSRVIALGAEVVVENLVDQVLEFSLKDKKRHRDGYSSRSHH